VRWVTYRFESDVDRVGLVVDDTIRALPAGTRLVELLGDDGERLADAAAQAQRSAAGVHPRAGVRLRPPIPNPPSIRDFSTFEQHMRNGLKAIGQEMGQDWYELPVFWFCNPNSLLGDGETVRVPGQTKKMDYELEVAAVVGKSGIDLDPAEAEQHIVGFTVYNDWSARDVQTREQAACPIGPAKGKDFGSSVGPVLVTRDELEPFRNGTSFDLTMTAIVNGQKFSQGRLCDMYWTFGEMLAYASQNATLVPGDHLVSGTCATGCILELSLTHGSEAYAWLEEGDEVVLEVEHLGRLTGRVTFNRPPTPLRAGLTP
jgi:2-keto-4-pentenoate hydratase/2-oxohepta-3-ene-1,7-dioic acid hydratase in catechol pathway